MVAHGDASGDFMDAFCFLMDRDFAGALRGQGAVAVAVSGGADSLAMSIALSEYLKGQHSEVQIFAYTVDHCLRKEAAEEARYVASVLSAYENITHRILTWDHGGKPDSRVQERAREARYDLMRGAMIEDGASILFTGHHLDDQAETFLFRLSKGSGVDGLACMRDVQEIGDGIRLCRPLLSFPKDDLIAFCDMRGIKFVDDPSNNSEDYARVRLRKSMDVLAEEGLSSKRLGVMARRMGRVRDALEHYADQAFDELAVIDTNRIEFEVKSLMLLPDDIILRVVQKAMERICPQEGYGVRMEKVESLCDDFCDFSSFRKRTLGGVIFSYDHGRDVLVLEKER